MPETSITSKPASTPRRAESTCCLIISLTSAFVISNMGLKILRRWGTVDGPWPLSTSTAPTRPQSMSWKPATAFSPWMASAIRFNPGIYLSSQHAAWPT